MGDYFRDLERWQDNVHATYNDLGKTLAMLPLPILIPDLDDEDTTEDMLDELVRIADSVIEDQPVSAKVKALIRQSIFDWLVVFDVGAVNVDAPERYREAVIEHHIGRIHGGCALAQGTLEQGDPLIE